MRLIDADALLDALERKRWYEGADELSATVAVVDAPTIDAVPVKHAKLVNPNPYGECSICGYLIDIRQEYNYCPNCGARMDGEREDNG